MVGVGARRRFETGRLVFGKTTLNLEAAGTRKGREKRGICQRIVSVFYEK